MGVRVTFVDPKVCMTHLNSNIHMVTFNWSLQCALGLLSLIPTCNNPLTKRNIRRDEVDGNKYFVWTIHC